MAKRGPKSKVDWDNIRIQIVEPEEPNPENQFAKLSDEMRSQRLKELYHQIHLRSVVE